MRRVVEVKRSGGTRVTRGKGPQAKEQDKRPEAPPSGAPAVENRDPGLPPVSGRNATRIVREAAKVLEAELAAGIHAAKRIEERFIDVQQLRSRNPEEVMQRFRRDTHELVDIIVDVLTVVVDSAANLSERSFSISGNRTPLARGSPLQRQLKPSVPTLATPTPVAPGQTVEIVISIENDSDQPTQPVIFKSSDLLSSEGGVIRASNVKYTPNEVVLQPKTSERITLHIHVPKGTPPGAYCGMFQANNLEAVRAALIVEVRGAE